MGPVRNVQLFQPFHPDDRALREARARLRRGSCPRRYCWWWFSLAFEWGVDTEDGCELPERWPGRVAPGHGPVCCRATGNPLDPDYHEPREPHLLEDGFAPKHFLVVGKRALRSKFARRARGEARERARRPED